MNDLEELKRMFAFHGFIRTPLEDAQIQYLLDQGHDFNSVYTIGCDIYCGVDPTEYFNKQA